MIIDKKDCKLFFILFNIESFFEQFSSNIKVKLFDKNNNYITLVCYDDLCVINPALYEKRVCVEVVCDNVINIRFLDEI